MADAREESNWWHTASLMAIILEPHRDKRKRSRPFSAVDFHPTARKRKPVQSKKEAVRTLHALHKALSERGKHG